MAKPWEAIGNCPGPVSGPARGPRYSAAFPNCLLLPRKEGLPNRRSCFSGPSSDGSSPLIRPPLPFSSLTPTLRQASLLVTHMTGLAGICARCFPHFPSPNHILNSLAHRAAPSSVFCFLCLCIALLLRSFFLFTLVRVRVLFKSSWDFSRPIWPVT